MPRSSHKPELGSGVRMLLFFLCCSKRQLITQPSALFTENKRSPHNLLPGLVFLFLAKTYLSKAIDYETKVKRTMHASPSKGVAHCLTLLSRWLEGQVSSKHSQVFIHCHIVTDSDSTLFLCEFRVFPSP